MIPLDDNDRRLFRFGNKGVDQIFDQLVKVNDLIYIKGLPIPRGSRPIDADAGRHLSVLAEDERSVRQKDMDKSKRGLRVIRYFFKLLKRPQSRLPVVFRYPTLEESPQRGLVDQRDPDLRQPCVLAVDVRVRIVQRIAIPTRHRGLNVLVAHLLK